MDDLQQIDESVWETLAEDQQTNLRNTVIMARNMLKTGHTMFEW